MIIKYKIAHVLLLILITLALLTTIITQTEFGLKVIIKNIIKNTPVNIEHIYGNMSKKITLKDITYKNDSYAISIKNISLKFKIKSLKTLLIKNIKIKKFKIKHLKIKYNKNTINIEADTYIKKNITNIYIKNLKGNINNKELTGKTHIQIKYHKITLKNSIFILGNNIIKLNQKTLLLKITTPNILHDNFKFKIYLKNSKLDKSFLIENMAYKSKKIKYMATHTYNKNLSKQTYSTISHFQSNNLYTSNVSVRISGYITNHIIYISSKYKKIKLKLHGKILNKNIYYIIKNLKHENNFIIKPTKLHINRTKFKINKITLKNNFKINKITFLSKIKLKPNKQFFGIFYIYYTNINIPEIKMLNKINTHCHIYIKFKIHDKIYYPLISTQSLIKFK